MQRFTSKSALFLTHCSEEVSRKLFDRLLAMPEIQPRVINARDRTIFDLQKEQVYHNSISTSAFVATVTS